MKNKILCGLMIAVIMAWSLSPQTYAMEKRPSVKKKASAKQTSTISKSTGKVTSCNLQNSTVAISASTGASSVITIDKNTLLTKGGKNIKLADIKSGDVVTVSYEAKKGVNIAKSISVQEKTTPASVSAPVSTKSKK